MEQCGMKNLGLLRHKAPRNDPEGLSLALNFAFGNGYQVIEGFGLPDCHIGQHLTVNFNP